MRIAADEQLEAEVHIYPGWQPPARCHVTWPGGKAVLVLGTWETLGDEVPQPIIDWVKAQEARLWELWGMANP